MKNSTIERILSVAVSLILCFSVIFCGNISASAEEIPNGNNAQSVPKIVINTESSNGCTLEKSDGYVDAHITITDTDGSVLDNAVKFKVRGNTTSLSWIEKKPFVFKFDKKKNVLGMGKGKKWALIANAFDPTLIRNYLAFETARELQIPFTSNQKYVELWLDGSYRGCYTLYEPVQEGSDRVDIDIESNNGMKDFLIEYESMREEEDTTYFMAENLRFIASEPETPNAKQLAYIQETMTDIVKTLRTGTQNEIESKIDISSFVKYYLLNEYFKTYDFSVSSVYFYYKDGKLYAGPPWDYDLSMGNTNNAYPGRCTEANSPQGIYADKNLYVYLARKEWFKDLVKTEYEAHYDYFAQLHTKGGIMDSIHSTYGDVFDRNYAQNVWTASKWWINIQRQPDDTYDENYNFLKNWLYERNVWFEEYLQPFVREYIVGDTDGDGEISINDATAVQRIIAGFESTDEDVIRGSVTNDALSIYDSTEIQKYLAGFKNVYGIGSKTKAKFR